jgi:hypothetical protein
MPRKAALPTNETDPRPTRSAFKPASKADLRADLIIAAVCLSGFLLGLLANLFGNFGGFAGATERGINGQTSILLQLLVFFGFPLFLIAAVYFVWHAWNHHRKTVYFQNNCQRAQALITHLWKEPPSGSGKRYFVGYRFNDTSSAFLQTDVYTFKRLQVGDSIPVDYLTDDPSTSFPELTGRKST